MGETRWGAAAMALASPMRLSRTTRVVLAAVKRDRAGVSAAVAGLIEVDVLLALLPILSDVRHYGLSEAEQRILAVAVVPVHDVGKETDAWQRYVRSAAAVPYVLPSVLPSTSTGTIARTQSPAIA